MSTFIEAMLLRKWRRAKREGDALVNRHGKLDVSLLDANGIEGAEGVIAQQSLRSLLQSYRDASRSEREKGNYFERLAVDFIKSDPGMAQEYEGAWLFHEWAATHEVDGRDTGIDAVAKIRGEDSFCAIQCKFYREGHRIQKADIDSFFTASGKRQFSRRLIIDTTDTPWSANAESALDDQDKPISRIGLDRLVESPIDWAAYLLRDEVKVGPRKQIRPHQQEAGLPPEKWSSLK